MFFHITLKRNLKLPPRHFGPNLRSTLVAMLHAEVEGTCTGRYGFIITVTSIENIGKGELMEGGFAVFSIEYKAIVFRPFQKEVLDAVVSNVTQMGLMAEVGPLEVFISQHLIPDDMSYDPTLECYKSEDETVTISKEDDIRLKIIGKREDATQIVAIGSIKEDYLGKIS